MTEPTFFSVIQERVGRRVELRYAEKRKPTATIVGRLISCERVDADDAQEGWGLRVRMKQGTWEAKKKGARLDAQRDWKEDQNITEFLLGPFATISHNVTKTYVGDPETTLQDLEEDEIITHHGRDVWYLAGVKPPLRSLRVTFLA